MGFADLYLSKQKGFRPYFSSAPSPELRFIVVIPAHLEPDVITSLESIFSCQRPKSHVEVMIILNWPENAEHAVVEHHRHSAETLVAWIERHSRIDFRFLLMEDLIMPVKHAGVGLARKSGMDQAVSRFNDLDRSDGFILSFDADSRCESNYLTAIEETLNAYPSTLGINLFFEHPVSGNEYPDAVYRGIIAYEMHLRYLKLFMHFTGFPYAFHTVGSCFGVRAGTYVSQGGMNKRKAGEDFYFLHKIIPLGGFREISHTCVIPSPRESGRVPFGTGAAISKYLSSGSDLLTYPPLCFHELKQFFQLTDPLFRMTPAEISAILAQQPPLLMTYLSDIHALASIREIQANSGSVDTFRKRFFRWFDAFKIMKYLNFACRTGYKQIPVSQAVRTLLRDTGRSVPLHPFSDLELLMVLREIEKGRI